MVRRCAVKFCQNKCVGANKQPVSFFRFPNNIDDANKWAVLIGREDLVDGNTINKRVCSDHFHKSSIRGSQNLSRVQLVPGSMPIVSVVLNEENLSEESLEVPLEHVSPEVNLLYRPLICEGVPDSSFVDTSVSEQLDFDDLDVTITPSKQMPSTIPCSTTNMVDGVTEPSVEDLCRLCAKNYKDMVSIYGNENINHNLESKIHKFLPFINLNESDLPKHICFNCFTIVIAFNNLWETSKETNEILNSLISYTTNKVKVNQENNITLNDDDDDDVHSLLMETDIHMLTADNDNQNTCETLINNVNKPMKNSSEEIIEYASQVEECVIETVSNTIRTNPNQKDDNQNGIKQSSFLLDALQRPPSHCNQNNIVSHDLDHTYTMLPEQKPKGLWRLAPANKNTIDHTYAMWQWEKISSLNLSETTPPEHTSFVCKKCPASYSEKSLLTKHMSVMHKKSDRLKCLKNKETTKITTRKLLVIKCNKCGRKFQQQNQLDKHRCRSKEERAATAAFFARFRVDIDGQQVYKCDQCSYYTKSPKKNSQLSFRQHYNLHSSGFDLMCDKCPKKFRTLNALKTHIEIVHLRIKKYSCFQCSKRFGALGTLKTHLLMHSGERPYMCDKCGKTFRHISKLRIHTRFVHQKEKKHQCPECDKPYFTASLVKAHIISTHTHIRNHVCQICKKAFYTRNNLWSHNQQVHSNPRKFMCNLCDKAFKIKKCFISHCQTKHNLIVPKPTSPLPDIHK